jgi:hypothetical protein
VTTVRLALLAPTSDGTGRRPTGSLEFKPTKRRNVAGDVVLPAAFSKGLTDPPPLAELAPTEPGWAWQVVERTSGGSPRSRYVTVPDTAEVVDYADLVEVDPATLDPVAEPEAAWTLALDQRVPAGGAPGQVLAKASSSDYDTAWADVTGGGVGGAVSSVNGHTGTVVLGATDVGAQPAGDYATNTSLTTGLAGKANTADLAAVATSGAYSDLSGKPTIPAAPSNATASAPGLVQLAGDLGGTATAPTVPGLAAKANTSSLAPVATSGAYADLTGKPTIPAAYTDEQAQDAVAAAIAAGTHVGISVGYNDAANSLSFTATGTTSPDATTSTKGIVQLAGDLAGTAAAPTVPGLASKVDTGDARLSDTRTPTDGSVTNAKVSATAAIALSKLAVDPLARANHTGTQPATTVTGLATVATSGAYADLTGTPTIPAPTTDASQLTTGTLPAARIADGSIADAKLASGTALTPAERTKLTSIATGATANATDAQLRDRATHTGTQSADTLTDGTTNKAFLSTERTKLSGIATAATANSADATLLNRANHTGTQPSSTLSDSTVVGRSVLTAADAATARAAIGAGTSSLALGTTSTTAKAGDYTPPDAATGTKGLVQLAGDLAGTAAAPTVPGLAGKLDTSAAPELIRDTMGAALVAGTNVTITVNDAADTITIASTGGGGGSSLNSTLDNIRYVSKGGSDANDGLSWATAKLTIGAAFTALGATAGCVYVGGGTYSMAPNFAPSAQDQILKGAGRSNTRINLNANGTLFNLVGTVGFVVEDLDLGFASSSITGTLATFSNAFTCRFNRVGFLGNGSYGTGTASQRGVFFTANAGDNYFYNCLIGTLATGVLADTVVNWFIGCQFIGNKVAVTGGSPTDATSGLFLVGCIFNEVGDAHIDITGIAQAWIVQDCWFELATNAIKVGTTGGLGPTLFSLTNCSIGAQTTCLTLNSAESTVIDGIQFINTGTTPTDISCPVPANLPYGRIGTVNSYNRTAEAVRAAVPAQWEGSGRIGSRAVTGNYTVANADVKGYALHATSGSALTITVPQDSAATSLPIGAVIPWRQYGAGQITFAAGTGATLVSRGSVFKSAGQYAEGVLTKTAANTWLLSGDISA